jgi:hypothetical protein
VTEPKKKGGARPNAGRKKNPVKQAVVSAGVEIDGRSVGGKEHAGWLIEQLNAIDPEMMRDLDLHVSSEPIKVPKDADDEQRAELEKAELQRRAMWEAKKLALKRWRKLPFEVQGWACLWFADRNALDSRRYLYDKAGHQAVKIINHVHDKPIDVNLNISLRERFKLALEKADQRVGKRS